MYKIKSPLVKVLILIAVILTSLKIKHSFTGLKADNFFLGLRKVCEIEKVLGKPSYIFDSQGQFGKSLVTFNDFKDGITIRVYLVNKMPPRFLVIKVSKNKETVIDSIIETS
jgi:hypothetical protein